MAKPFKSRPKGQSDNVPVVRVAPILPWQELPPLAYRVVELSTEGGTTGKKSLPARERSRILVSEDAESGGLADDSGTPFYQMAESDAESAAEVRRRRRQDARMLAMLIREDQQQRKPKRREWHRETRWYQCLFYPLVAWRALLGLAAAMALATGWLVHLLPGLEPLGAQALVLSPLQMLVPLLLLAYGCAFLQCVLNAAVAGEPPDTYWPRCHIHVVLRYAGRWLFCFLAGPAVLGGAAIAYWIHCGDLDILDRLILAELGIVALAYWLFALLAATRSGRFYDANPWRIAELIHRLGYRSAVAIVVACLLAYQHGCWMLGAIEVVHRTAFVGWLLLMLCWLSALAWAAFLLRLVGLWCFGRVGLGRPQGPPEKAS
jgi:hypothetical protein